MLPRPSALANRATPDTSSGAVAQMPSAVTNSTKWSVGLRQRQGIAQHGRHHQHRWCPPNLRFYLQSAFRQLFDRIHASPTPMRPVATTVWGGGRRSPHRTGKYGQAMSCVCVSMSLHVLAGQELLPRTAYASVLIPCMRHAPSQHPWAQVASLRCLRVAPSHCSQVALESSVSSASILRDSASESAHHPRRCDPCPQGGIWLVA